MLTWFIYIYINRKPDVACLEKACLEKKVRSCLLVLLVVDPRAARII
jgi:hypothetical protein